MASNMRVVLFVLCVSFFICNILCVFAHNNYEDAELEKQVQKLNKPPIKTIKAEDGNIFDCVDVNKQPALDHPLLKNHIIQIKPSSFSSRKENSSGTDKSFKSLFAALEECPPGTVPIQRTTKEHLIRARSLLDAPASNESLQAIVSLGMKPSFTVYGGGGDVSIQNLALTSDQFSSANIWVQSGTSTSRNYIAAGLMVSPLLYGDSRTRLFGFWTGDGNQNTGCYNTLCPGFVQVDSRLTPASLVSPASVYGGPQYVITIQVYQDRSTGNWWFMVSDRSTDVAIGYWPSNIFPNMQFGATQVAWGGIAKADSKTGISPPMGNGRFPDGNYTHASHFSDVHYINDRNTMVSLGNQVIYQQIDKPKCYSLMNTQLLYSNLGYSFSFGGPGGLCG